MPWFDRPLLVLISLPEVVTSYFCNQIICKNILISHQEALGSSIILSKATRLNLKTNQVIGTLLDFLRS